jgi:hypothetical protein
MNIFQYSARAIIKNSFHFSVWLIEQFYDMRPYIEKKRLLKNYPEGSLGRDISDCLEANNLNLVPHFESHDLKHTLLGYEMNAVDEIRMQAFMIGNGNYTIASFTIFIFGMMLLPDLWLLFYKDFSKGELAQPISTWQIDEFAKKPTEQLRREIFNYNTSPKKYFTMRTLAKSCAIIVTIAGICGMLYCMPFLFSSSLADLIGAGFPFVGASILTSGGLIALSSLVKHSKTKHVLA